MRACVEIFADDPHEALEIAKSVRGFVLDMNPVAVATQNAGVFNIIGEALRPIHDDRVFRFWVINPPPLLPRVCLACNGQCFLEIKNKECIVCPECNGKGIAL